MATVRTKKRGKTYTYYFEAGKTEEGKRRTISKGGFATQKEAYSAGAKALIDFQHGNIGITSDKITFREFSELWFEKIKPALRKTSQLAYRNSINKVSAIIGNMYIQEIKPRNIDAAITKLASRGYSQNTLKSHMAVLKVLFDYAIYPAELISQSPLTNIRIPKTAPASVVERIVINQDQLQETIADKQLHYFEPATIILYHTGMRIGEVFGLLWDNVDLENRFIYVRKQRTQKNAPGEYNQPLKKDTSERDIAIGEILYKYLVRLKLEYEKDKKSKGYFHIYIDSNGVPTQTTSLMDREEINPVVRDRDGRIFSKSSFMHFLSKHGLNSHSFRHTHATMLAEAEAPSKNVAARLGHSNTLITDKLYTHFTDALQKATSKYVDKALDMKNADKI